MKINPKHTFLSKNKQAPHSIVYTGKSDLKTSIRQFIYNNEEIQTIETYESIRSDYANLIVIEGLEDHHKIITFAKSLGINEFHIEDIFNVTQRNKYVSTESQCFMILKYPYFKDNNLGFRYISFIVFDNTIILFTDYKNEYVDVLLNRVQENKALFLSFHASYLLYAVYDMIVDEQLEIARMYKEELEELEGDIWSGDSQTAELLFRLQKNLVQLRNNVRSMSESASPNNVVMSALIDNATTPYFDDLSDHIQNLLEKLNTRIELCHSLITMYSTQISTKTNEVMKILTLISVVFIPLSFLAGVFGMNFTEFPILSYEHGLLLFILTSVFITGGMIAWVKFKKWF